METGPQSLRQHRIKLGSDAIRSPLHQPTLLPKHSPANRIKKNNPNAAIRIVVIRRARTFIPMKAKPTARTYDFSDPRYIVCMTGK
jgi:hypothetical protein